MAKIGKSADKLVKNFEEHFRKIVHKTISDHVPIEIVEVGDKRLVQFSKKGEPICIPVGKGGYHFFAGQTLCIVVDNKEQRLKTLRYEYRITCGPKLADWCLIRWEYNSLGPGNAGKSLFPRNHIQITTKMPGLQGKELNLSALHIPTGWVTLEEVARFLINEFGVKPTSTDWDAVLHEGEKKFKKWTGVRI